MMVSIYILVILLLSFAISIFLLPLWIKKARSIGLLWEDMNKFTKSTVAGSGGVVVLLAFLLSSFCYVAYRTFVLDNQDIFLLEIFAILIMITFMGSIGFIDDLFGWRKGGLKMKTRILLSIFGSIPLIAINAGKSIIGIPFIGEADLGLLYPLFFIPLGVVATTTTFNMLAGFNGLEAGQGILLMSAISFVAYLTGSSWLSIICLCMALALIGFLVYNWSPAKVFPGDVMTYSVGALIAAASIVGNFEKIAVFFYIPYMLEVVLKLRGSLKKSSFAKPVNDGSLDLLHNKIYSLNHLAILLFKKLNIRPTEKRAVILILGFQAIVILAGLIIFRNNLF